MTPETPATPYTHGSVSESRAQTNPLRSLTISRAISLMESAQRGDFLELQWLYWFVEQTQPVLFALQERRYGRLAEMDWQAKVIPKQRRRASFDEGLAAEQVECLAEAYDRIDNLKEAVEHLASATFRLYAHVNIQRAPDGTVNHLEPLDQWNFLRAGMFGDWFWNPTANVTHWRALPAENKIVPEDFLIRQVARHIDRPGLIKYIRQNLGEKDWSGFLEIYGIPTPVLVMPEGTPENQKALYEAACKAISDGRAVAVPYGTGVEYPGEVRGNAPFSEYLKFCDEQMVLIGTGGLLTMLSMPQGIGAGSTDAHADAFQSIAAGEALRISELFQKRLDKEILAAAFPGKPVLAYFEIATQDATDPGIVLDHAVKAKAAGLQIDAAELSEKTGYTLTAAPVAPVVPPPESMPMDEADDTEDGEDEALNKLPAAAVPPEPQGAILDDWFKRVEQAAQDAKDEAEFLAKIEALIQTMPAEVLTPENIKRLAAPLEKSMAKAVLMAVAQEKKTP